LPIYLHTYVWPFLLFGLCSSRSISPERYDRYIQGSEWTFVWAGSIVTLQALTWLATKWNVNVDALFTSTKAKDVQQAQLIKVVPVTNAGSAEICTLIRDKVGSSTA
jgi:cation-transporting ATPase 13A1